MYSRLLILLLTVFGHWNPAQSECVGSPFCLLFDGVFYNACPDVVGEGGTQPDTALIECGPNVENEFTANPQMFIAPGGVNTFVITDIFIPDDVIVTLGHVSCPSGGCAVMKLTSEAQAPIAFQIEGPRFKIRASGDGVILKFQCDPIDRQCAKEANGGMMKRMVNSVEAIPHEFPFMARLQLYYSRYNSPDDYASCNRYGYTNDAEFMMGVRRECTNNQQVKKLDCGGSIIHPNWILSIANCFPLRRRIDGQNGWRLIGVLVVVGDHLRNSNDPEREVRWVPNTEIIKHPQVNNPSRFNNDIALLKLSSPITLNPNSRYPICLPPAYMAALDFVGSQTTLAGWGVESNFLPTNELKKEYFDVVTNAECANVFSQYNLPITENMLCNKNTESHPCYGDGGGPAWCTGENGILYEIGVMSFASTDITTIWKLDEPNGNTRVTNYLDWIKAEIAPDVLP